jgi:hypothetical protein
MLSQSPRTPPRKGRCFYKYIFLFAAGVVLSGSLFLSLSDRNVLSIVNESRDRTLLRKAVTEGFEFATRIRHSVQLTPVYEYYRIGPGGEIAVVATKLQDLGWGMPSTEKGSVVFKDGFMLFEGISRTLKELRFRVSAINEAVLIIGDRQIDLNPVVGDGELLVFTVRKEPTIIALLKGEVDVFQEETKTGAFR